MGVPVLIAHDRGCNYARPAAGGHTDAAKRVADTWNLHLAAAKNARGSGFGLTQMGRWIAVALADGTSDGTCYERRIDAVRFQHHNERFYAYLQLQPFELTVCMAESYLYMHRLCYDAGGLMADPEMDGSGHELIPALTVEDFADQMSALARRDWIRTVTPHDLSPNRGGR